ncbi:hypothetical protein KAU85_01525 [Candidatus Bathyarchaeota archaeon]|nr:hypothetical protein [Candidatus Bathyarchaeota archaeon]
MVNCPKCGKPLVKSAKKYFCEDESCPVIYVRCPSNPYRMRIAVKALIRQEMIERI